MNGPPSEPGLPAPPKEDPEALVLRSRPRAPVRFRRGLIVGAAGALAAALVTLSWVGLEPPSFRKAASPVESDGLAGGQAADALANAPTNYGEVPRLGPPLPGDLGRPILEHERSLGEGPVALDPGAAETRSATNAGRERAAIEAARSSPVLVQLDGDRAPGPRRPEPVQVEVPGSPSAAAASQEPGIDPGMAMDGDRNPHALRPAPSPWTLSAGSVIPASLVTGLNSGLPGMVIAQVTENVRDSATGRTILVPQGARLIGSYDSRLAYGQRRALLVWTRILFPDGSSIALDKMPAADASGYAGLSDRVDSHGLQLIKGILLSTLLGAGTELGLGSSESDLVRAVRESAQQNAANAGEQVTARNLDIQPTITVRPGWPVRALVNQDLVLRPWRG